ncbi:1,2-phenylacetyl-CoA epoxidase subunit PaaE [Actinopolyspora halophila]|uniref:1,2-phenylacetyl-CoA epoxidase subunit PaaE n=1 Tax=Actinopolyspora halophila TaxID=1850 RepID=UPI000365A8FA|nr:1,2-phenylacetyl-CoA epoxidase subunit PaaE [Actinopolyspora halophila]
MSTPTVSSPRTRGDNAFHTLRVADVEKLCDDAVAVTFDVPAELAELFDFRPGQSLTLRRWTAEGEHRRSYSICARRGERLRIGVRLVPGGMFSGWLTGEVGAGDEVEVQPPSGRFTPEPDTSGRHVLIAAGSGITPVLSIASSLLAETGSTVTVVYGNRRSDTVMFIDELADLKDRYPARFELVHVLSREPRESELVTGRLDEDKLRGLLGTLIPLDGSERWWLCGPYGMVDAAGRVLDGLGVPPDRVRRELFYVDELPPEPVRHEEETGDGSAGTGRVTLDGRTTEIALDEGTPVLDAAQRVRSDLPFACKGGVCGTCRARVTEGQVRMRRNFALEQTELDDGFVLTCQALPVSEEVAVDYDV